MSSFDCPVRRDGIATAGATVLPVLGRLSAHRTMIDDYSTRYGKRPHDRVSNLPRRTEAVHAMMLSDSKVAPDMVDSAPCGNDQFGRRVDVGRLLRLAVGQAKSQDEFTVSND